MLRVCGNNIKIEGRLIRIARLDLDKYEFLDDPGAMLEGLRSSGIRIDLFTFLQRLTETLQKLPDTSPKYDYPMQWDNLAVLPVTTFDHCSTQQSGFEARNKAKHAEKKVVVREVPVDDVLVRGIWGLTIPQKGGG